MKRHIIESKKIVYTFRLRRNDCGALKIIEGFDTSPDSDSCAIGQAMEQIKDKQVVTVTMTIDESSEIDD